MTVTLVWNTLQYVCSSWIFGEFGIVHFDNEDSSCFGEAGDELNVLRMEISLLRHCPFTHREGVIPLRSSLVLFL